MHLEIQNLEEISKFKVHSHARGNDIWIAIQIAIQISFLLLPLTRKKKSEIRIAILIAIQISILFLTIHTHKETTKTGRRAHKFRHLNFC